MCDGSLARSVSWCSTVVTLNSFGCRLTPLLRITSSGQLSILNLPFDWLEAWWLRHMICWFFLSLLLIGCNRICFTLGNNCYLNKHELNFYMLSATCILHLSWMSFVDLIYWYLYNFICMEFLKYKDWIEIGKIFYQKALYYVNNLKSSGRNAFSSTQRSAYKLNSQSEISLQNRPANEN